MEHLSEKTISGIKSIFNYGFILILFLYGVQRAFLLLPKDWLFFVTSDAMENLLAVCIAYTLYFYVFNFWGLWQKSGYVLLCLLLLSGLAILKDIRIDGSVRWNDTFGYLTSFLGLTLLFYLLLYFFNRVEDLNNYKKLRDELRSAKEQLLRDQMHPHFLYNAFNSLYSLSIQGHGEVSEYILKLSGMMRYLTDDTHVGKVPISKELDFIEKYVSIEKLRFGDDSDIELKANKKTEGDRFIAPFLLIPLVENAFKHGFYTNSRDAFVDINFHLIGNKLNFVVKNSVSKKQHFQENQRSGKGLGNLKERLQLLYKKNAALEVVRNHNTFTAKLEIILD